MIGSTVGGYQIIEQIGQGGMATVYKAFDPNTERHVAIKILPQHQADRSVFRERFRREAKAIARLEHPHILPIFASGEDNDVVYLVMRYMPSGTLSQLMQQRDLELPEIGHILTQIGDALDYAHQHNILHRDVKPSNILIDNRGNAYLTDFGIAKMVEGSLDLTGGSVLGTPKYMSPEQCRGSEALTPATDQYSLGVMLYEMVLGQAPYDAETPLAVIYMHLNDPLPLPRTIRPDLPEGVQNVLLRALAKDPNQRYPNCTAFAQAFGRAISGAVGAAPPETERINKVEKTMVEHRTPPVINTPVQQTFVESRTPPPQQPQMAAPQFATSEPPRKGGFPTWAYALIGLVLLCALVGGGGALGYALFGSQLFPSGNPTRQAAVSTSTAPASGGQATSLPTSTEAAASGTDEPIVTEESAAPTDAPATEEISAQVTAPPNNEAWNPVIESVGGTQMVLVPAGCFQMGSSDGDGDERPVTEVCFDEAYWIDLYEVTIGEYTGANNDDHPVQRVNWFEGQAHCEGRGGSLPTEAQWEYAVRGPSGWTYPWGEVFEPSYMVWNVLESQFVGTYPQNASWVGAQDLLGNVYEWVNSKYLPYPYDANDGREDPANVDSETARVIRGGSYATDQEFTLRGSFRFSSTPTGQYNGIGFRCALPDN